MGEYATFCCVLTAYAESDFKWDARSKNPVNASGYYSEGVFQQTLPWWKNNHFSVTESCNAFLDNFKWTWGYHDKPLDDHYAILMNCWLVQRWNDKPAFNVSPETLNYQYRIEGSHGYKPVSQIIAERRVV